MRDDLNYLQVVMEFAPGGDLAKWLKSRAQLGEFDQLDLCNQMAAGGEPISDVQRE